MFHATKIIKEAFIEKGFPIEVTQVIDNDSRSSFIIPLPVEGTSMQRLQFINTDDENDVAIRLFGIVTNVPDSKRAAMLEAVNECNSEYRFLKFVLDSDGDVNVEYDISDETCDNCIGQTAIDIGLGRVHSILGKAYPILMRALWS